ncbi:RFC checkpoint protein Rad17 [Pseudogymnoascus australis]
MAPPAKRPRRNVVVSSPPSAPKGDNGSDDEYTQKGTAALIRAIDFNSSPIEEPSPFVRPTRSLKQPPTPTKSRQSTLTSNGQRNTTSLLPSQSRTGSRRKSASTSPEKPRAKGRPTEKGKSQSLYTFFSTQVQKQQTQSARLTGERNREVLVEDDEEISDEDEVPESKAKISSSFAAAAAKRTRDVMEGGVSVISGSQRFMRPPAPVQANKKEENSRPWADRFAPTDLEELAVHKKKVSDVRGWLDAVMGGKLRQRLLILKGAAGAGKTTTVQLLAKSMGAEILEWRNPAGSMASDEGFVSMAAQFEEFMGRGGKFGQLDIFSGDEPTTTSTSGQKPLDRRKNIILIEEFPNTITRASTALHNFRSTLLQYLAANTPHLQRRTPASLRKPPSPPFFTTHRLLGPEILHHPAVATIEFNPVAPTLLAKALTLAVQKEARASGRRKTPGPLVLKRLAEIGDVRSAVASLQFLCLRGEEGDWGGKVAFSSKGKKAAGRERPMTKMEEESLELVTRREASLGIFHARAVEVLPRYLADAARPRPSQVNPSELIDEMGTDTSTFISALHENYILSCDPPASSAEDSSDLAHAIGCIDTLSAADLLTPSWESAYGQGGAGDVARQDELAFQVAVRGLLFALPDPVKRRAAPGKGGRGRGGGAGGAGDAFKMFYPTSLKLWRQKEEVGSLVDLAASRLLRREDGVGTTGAAMAKSESGTVEGWRRDAPASSAAATSTEGGELDAPSPSLAGLGASARTEMLLERLPYLFAIHMSRTRSVSLPLPRAEMERVVRFVGLGGVGEDDEEGVGSVVDLDGKGEESERKVKILRPGAAGVGKGLEERFGALKAVGTVLSDDDIED